MKLNRTAVAAALLMPLAACDHSGLLTKDQVSRDKERIEAAYKSAMVACGTRSGNAKDICEMQAKGNEKVARAELEMRNKATPESREAFALARAEAERDVARQRCDDLAGNPKDVCLKDAEAVFVRNKADAKVAVTAAEAGGNAQEKVADAQEEAAKVKREADYVAAKERCDSLAGDARDNCIARAKADHGM